MKDRIKHWKSTIIGVVILIGGGYLAYHEKASLTEVVGVLTAVAGMYGLFYKPKKSDENGKA